MKTPHHFAALALALCALACSGCAESSPTSEQATNSPRAAATPDELLSPENEAQARRALDALSRLQSATEARPSRADYGPRVTDAKAEIDAALRALKLSTKSDHDFADELREAIADHVNARDLWDSTADSFTGLFYPRDRPALSARYGLAQKAHAAGNTAAADYLTPAEALSIIWGKARERAQRAEALAAR